MTTATKARTELTAAEVEQFLLDHPDFFQKRAALLGSLDVPHRQEGAISLVERQVKSLRDQHRKLQGQLIDVLRNAQDNERLFQQTGRLLYGWLGVSTRAELLARIKDDLREVFAIDHVGLFIEGYPGHESPLAICRQLQVHFPDSQPICGSCELLTGRWLFGDDSDAHSMAMVPLGPQASTGLLVLGSAGADEFRATMGTLFLDHIGQTLSRTLDYLD